MNKPTRKKRRVYQGENAFYRGRARRFLDALDSENACHFLEMGCRKDNTPTSLRRAVVLCNVYFAGKEDDEGFKLAPVTYYTRACKRVRQYLRTNE
jgi:hypothetical protein